MVISHSYVKLPEGMEKKIQEQPTLNGGSFLGKSLEHLRGKNTISMEVLMRKP